MESLMNQRMQLAKEASKNQSGLEEYIRKLYEVFSSIEGDQIMRWMAPTLCSCDFENKELVVSYPLEKRFANPSGKVLHGGMTSSFFDSAMGCMASFFAEGSVDTISLSVDYARSILVEQPIMIRVKLAKAGRTIHYLTAEAFQEPESDRILATAKGTFFAHH